MNPEEKTIWDTRKNKEDPINIHYLIYDSENKVDETLIIRVSGKASYLKIDKNGDYPIERYQFDTKRIDDVLNGFLSNGFSCLQTDCILGEKIQKLVTLKHKGYHWSIINPQIANEEMARNVDNLDKLMEEIKR